MTASTSKANERFYHVNGVQVVEVGGYSYLWNGTPPLQVGDRVRIPANWLFPESDGVVNELGSTYHGKLSSVLRRVPSQNDA